MKRSVLLVFVDGLGLAPRGVANPLARLALPQIKQLLGGDLTCETLAEREVGQPVLFRPLDACLGLEGLPQSATGQASLFTGHNASQLLGRHVPALPGARLRALIEEHSVFRTLSLKGFDCAFANAFSDGFFEYLKQPRRRRPSASLVAALAGGVRLRSQADLGAGDALSWDVTGQYFGVPLQQLRLKPKKSDVVVSDEGFEVALVEPEEAGRRLGALASARDFTLYETFLTDLAGHGRYLVDAQTALERVDGLLGGLLRARQEHPHLTVVVSSDHGNVEDAATQLHTRNAVPLIAFGPGASEFSAAESLVDVVPAIECCLSRSGG